MNKLISLGQAVKNLRMNNISNSYFLYGNDIYMQDFFISMIKKIMPDSQTYLFHLGYDNQENIFNEISNTSLFDSRKTIIIKNINKFSVKAKNELIELINKNDLNHCIIFVKNNYDNKNKFIESLIKHSTSIDVRTPFESKMYEWVKFFLNQENIKIDLNEIPKYIEHFGSNISNVMNYIKIDSLSKNNSNTNRTYHLWNLQDSVGKKDLLKSIEVYRSLLSNGSSQNLILIYLYNFYKALYLQKFYGNDSGLNYNYTINKIIKSKMFSYSKKISKYEVENILVRINDIDYYSKNISINIDNRMKCLFNNICTSYYDR